MRGGGGGVEVGELNQRMVGNPPEGEKYAYRYSDSLRYSAHKPSNEQMRRAEEIYAAYMHSGTSFDMCLDLVSILPDNVVCTEAGKHLVMVSNHSSSDEKACHSSSSSLLYGHEHEQTVACSEKNVHSEKDEEEEEEEKEQSKRTKKKAFNKSSSVSNSSASTDIGSVLKYEEEVLGKTGNYSSSAVWGASDEVQMHNGTLFESAVQSLGRKRRSVNDDDDDYADELKATRDVDGIENGVEDCVEKKKKKTTSTGAKAKRTKKGKKENTPEKKASKQSKSLNEDGAILDWVKKNHEEGYEGLTEAQDVKLNDNKLGKKATRNSSSSTTISTCSSKNIDETVNETVELLSANDIQGEEASGKDATSRPHHGVRPVDKRIKEILWNWLKDHLSHPFLNETEKEEFSRTTGLSRRKLADWFVNARRRLLTKVVNEETGKMEYVIKEKPKKAAQSKEENRSKPKRTRARFDEDAVAFLRSWLYEHVSNPFPTKEEKAMMREKTKMTKEQLEVWWWNARRNLLVRRVGPNGGLEFSLREQRLYS